MSKPISVKELAAIRKSVTNAERMLVERYQGFYFIGRPGEGVRIDRGLLFRAYRHTLGRVALPLNSSAVKSLLLQAAEANDRKFFVNLGKSLASEGIPPSRKKEMSKLQHFLLRHWAEEVDDLPALFYLTPIALTHICRDKLHLKGLSRDVVIKTRQRLGLKCFKRLKRDAVRAGGRWLFPQVDKI